MACPEGEVSQGRSDGRAPDPLPASANPTDIAMGSLSRDASLDNPARRLLTQQAALVAGQRKLIRTELRQRRLQLIGARIGIAFKVALIAAFLFVVFLLALLIVDALRSENLVVEAFQVPQALAEDGATGEVVAAGIVDELVRLEAATQTEAQRHSTGNSSSNDIKVEAPQSGVPFGQIRRLLTTRIGNDTRLSGDVTRSEDGTLRLTIRGDSLPARSFTGRFKNLPALSVQAAEYVYGSAEPARFLLYLNQSGRGAEALRLAPGTFQAADDNRDRSIIAARWAAALAAQGRYDEARERAQIAVSLDPFNWAAYSSYVGAMTNEEQALAASRGLRRRAAGSRRNRRPPETIFIKEYLLTQDWTALRRIYLQNARDASGHGTTDVMLGPSLAEVEAYRHDHQSARRLLSAADPFDHIVRPTSDFTAGLRELDLGRADLALAPLERFHRGLMSNLELRHFFRGYQCYLAIAYARLGRTADALRVVDAEPESSRCRAFRGDIFALAGKWPAAANAYRTAIRLSPSLPIAYERAGAALLARDEPERATRLFRASIERGPHWADPRFGLAEALMQLGRFEEAEREYGEAARYAPRWGALHMGWGEALWRLGRRGEARERFRSAAAMDLSAANRARLEQLAGSG
jgi:tetratricopeptide (TPR) repeat protein